VILLFNLIDTLKRYENSIFTFRGCIDNSQLYFSPSETENKNAKPNIVVLNADDLGYADVGFNNSKRVETPCLDGLIPRPSGSETNTFAKQTPFDPSGFCLGVIY
jgi:hypothetical protein